MPVQMSTTIAPGAALVTVRIGMTPIHLTANELDILIAHLQTCRNAMLPRPAPTAAVTEVAAVRAAQLA